MHDAMVRLGPPDFDAADRAYAEQIRATLKPEDIAAPWKRVGMKDTGSVLADFIVPLGSMGELSLGSTDVGDVSWKVPTVQADGATCAVGTPFHSWQLTAQGKTAAAHKGMVHVAKAMAAVAAEAMADPALRAAATAEHAARLAVTPYVCPLPPDVTPPIGMSGP